MADGFDLSALGSTQPAAAGDQVGRSRLAGLFALGVVASVVLPRVPYGRGLLYPFALLGTWAHEMGHGLTALLTGGSFERLEIYRNLGGVAFTGTGGGFTRALVSAGGLLGPAVVGALVIVVGARSRTAGWTLAGLALLVLLSVAAFVRNGFGIGAMLVIGVALGLLGRFAPELVRIGVAQLVGIQLALASWGSLDYLFTKNFQRGGRTLDSDTQNIADELFLPYWFWGGLIFGVSLLTLGAAFYVAWIRPANKSTA